MRKTGRGRESMATVLYRPQKSALKSLKPNAAGRVCGFDGRGWPSASGGSVLKSVSTQSMLWRHCCDSPFRSREVRRKDLQVCELVVLISRLITNHLSELLYGIYLQLLFMYIIHKVVSKSDKWDKIFVWIFAFRKSLCASPQGGIRIPADAQLVVRIPAYAICFKAQFHWAVFSPQHTSKLVCIRLNENGHFFP